MDICACVSVRCNVRHSCHRYMGVRGERQAYADMKWSDTCDKMDIRNGTKIMSTSEADSCNERMNKEYFACILGKNEIRGH